MDLGVPAGLRGTGKGKAVLLMQDRSGCPIALIWGPLWSFPVLDKCQRVPSPREEHRILLQ